MLKNTPEIFKILSYKNSALSTPCLHKFSFPLSLEDEDFIFKLFDTLRYNKGVYEKRGLAIAAPQVGVFKKVFVIGIGGKLPARQIMALINPEIVDKSKEVSEDYEGCLSIPKLLALVERPREIVVKFTNLRGKIEKIEMNDLLARIIQHEIDHLNGRNMLMIAKNIKDNELYTEFKQKLQKQNKDLDSDDETGL